MRMQLGKIIATLGFVLVGSALLAQETTPPDTGKIKLDNIEVTFLSSYYEQDGNHSPVTGGVGTEVLDNIAPSIIVNVPLDTVRSIAVNAGVDFYSSASSDNINNPFLLSDHVSSASAHDTRYYATLGYKRKNNQKNTIKGLDLGFSNEYDVLSIQAGLSYAKSSADHNREINFKAKYFYDDWKLIYPVEFRNGPEQLLPTDKRSTFTLSATGSTVINKRMNASISSDIVVQSGLLSTPFHRVYFSDIGDTRIEMLPSQRVKIPVGLRFNYHINDALLLRTFYRFYVDTWGMTGNTLKVELPVKIGKSFRLYPFYRFHTQSAVDYFAPFKEHSSSQEFYTSDYDLSTFTSQKYGLGFSISPLYGIGRMKGILRKDRSTMFKSFDFRYAIYDRSDGLKASIFSVALKFEISR
jgi:hypothetical protein